MAYDEGFNGAQGATGLNFIAGLWLFFSGIFMSVAGASGNNMLFGAIVAILAAIRYFSSPRAVWLSWLNVLCGLWTIISPWALHFSAARGATTNNVIVGIVIAVLGVWAALGTPVERTTTGTTARVGV